MQSVYVVTDRSDRLVSADLNLKGASYCDWTTDTTTYHVPDGGKVTKIAQKRADQPMVVVQCMGCQTICATTHPHGLEHETRDPIDRHM